MSVPTITRARYNTLRSHDYAGPVTSLLLAETRRDWPATHWMLASGESGGTALIPVNVIDAADEPASLTPDQAESLGYAAGADQRPNSPFTEPAIAELCRNSKVGEHLDVLHAYNRGWHRANAAGPTTTRNS